MLRRLSRRALDILAPERCAACETMVAATTLFCHACRAAVNVLGTAELAGARAFAEYDAHRRPRPVADALHAFKYRGAWRLAPRLATAMVACADAGDATPLVVPVPLHPARLRSRGFNQSALLAAHLARVRRWPAAPALLVRTRDTLTQTALDLAARRANVAGAFALRRPGSARGRHILLVDDVWTSGATTSAIGRVLRDDGAAAVDVLTFARVL
ncbi:MAG TPA: ComF family protein [Candidatus Binatia bacterium]|jgi:ComF family protein